MTGHYIDTATILVSFCLLPKVSVSAEQAVLVSLSALQVVTRPFLSIYHTI